MSTRTKRRPLSSRSLNFRTDPIPGAAGLRDRFVQSDPPVLTVTDNVFGPPSPIPLVVTEAPGGQLTLNHKGKFYLNLGGEVIECDIRVSITPVKSKRWPR